MLWLFCSFPDLVELVNSRGENILLFLVQTVGRQLVEQRQYQPASTSKLKEMKKAGFYSR